MLIFFEEKRYVLNNMISQSEITFIAYIVGSVYENFKHDIANLEEKVTLRYMEEMRKNGIHLKMPGQR